jgi:hypothetical protein
VVGRKREVYLSVLKMGRSGVGGRKNIPNPGRGISDRLRDGMLFERQGASQVAGRSGSWSKGIEGANRTLRLWRLVGLRRFDGRMGTGLCFLSFATSCRSGKSMVQSRQVQASKRPMQCGSGVY